MPTKSISAALIGLMLLLSQSSALLDPDAAEMNQQAPAEARVRLDTTKGVIHLEMRRTWSTHGVDRFYNLVRNGYYDDTAIFRVRAGTFAQFGINGDPRVSRTWRTRSIPDDPRVLSNVRGTIAYAFKDPNGRTTQVFINLRDNSAADDPEPFVPFARVIEGMDVADAFNAVYGEGLGGIRAGKQDAAFDEGNAFFRRAYPRLDYIIKTVIE